MSDNQQNDVERMMRTQAVVTAALNFFQHTHTTAFLIPVPGTTPKVYVAAGEAEEIRELLDKR
jgi:hypothetical protein